MVQVIFRYSKSQLILLLSIVTAILTVNSRSQMRRLNSLLNRSNRRLYDQSTGNTNRRCIHRDRALMSCEFYSPNPDRSHPASIHHFDVNSIRQLAASRSSSKDLPKKYAPMICHIVSENQWTSIVDLIAFETKLASNFIAELVDFGSVFMSSTAVYHNEASQHRKPPAVERIKSLASLEGKTISPGTYIRVHVNPNRYYGGYGINWSDRVLRPSICPTALLIVDKPFDLPAMETTSSRKENVAYEVATHIQRNHIEQPMHTVSRLDACTSGLIPLVCNPSAAAIFSKAIANQTVRKMYKVLVQASQHQSDRNIPLGSIKHCFRRISPQSQSKKPTLLRSYDQSLLEASDLFLKTNVSSGRTWQRAELNILTVTEIKKSELDLSELVWNSDSEGFHGIHALPVQVNDHDVDHDATSTVYYECLVELVTGRTHQIRLQFAALGFHVVGDCRYAPAVGLLDEDGSTSTWGDGTGLFGPEPRIIGLQCCQLGIPRSTLLSMAPRDTNRDVKDASVVQSLSSNSNVIERDHAASDIVFFECGAPWWRRQPNSRCEAVKNATKNRASLRDLMQKSSS